MSTHSIFNHIVPQLNKFVQGINKSSSRSDIIEALYNEVNNDGFLRAFVRDKIGSGEIYRFINNVVRTEPILVVIIDKANLEVEEACNSIPFPRKKVLEFNVYERIDAGIKNAFIFDSLIKNENDNGGKKGLDGIPHGTKLRVEYNGKIIYVEIIDGNVVLNGEKYGSVSSAGMAVTGYSVNGWDFWEYYDKKNKEWKEIDNLREKEDEKVTLQSEYEIPMLESIIELGGSGKVQKILENVFEKMEDKLTEADLSRYSRFACGCFLAFFLLVVSEGFLWGMV